MLGIHANHCANFRNHVVVHQLHRWRKWNQSGDTLPPAFHFTVRLCVGHQEEVLKKRTSLDLERQPSVGSVATEQEEIDLDDVE